MSKKYPYRLDKRGNGIRFYVSDVPDHVEGYIKDRRNFRTFFPIFPVCIHREILTKDGCCGKVEVKRCKLKDTNVLFKHCDNCKERSEG